MPSQNFNRQQFAARIASYALLFCLLICSEVAVRSAVAQDNNVHLYFFTNEGCAPCRQVEPGIEALQREGYPVTTIYLSAHPDWGARYQVDRTPTVIMVSENKVVGRHAGLIDAVTLKSWFSTVGFASPSGSTKQLLTGRGAAAAKGRLGGSRDFVTPTMHNGTRRPRNASEQLAMQATVRLKVDDPEGTSYATGTVIHSHQGESLVVTCGHVFRDANGKGEITAEYGFANGQRKTAAGELVFYDADARDIGLVAIRTSDRIVPVPIAGRDSNIDRGLDIFSIGCDHGEDPTIRRSRIKNRAAYDGAIKYDIYGRPVDGRSGGGLFTADGEFIGVCNAAVVEVDEGIYTALDTVYWQLAKVNLDHLFTTDNRVAQLQQSSNLPSARAPVQMPVDGAGTQTTTSNGVGQRRTESPKVGQSFDYGLAKIPGRRLPNRMNPVTLRQQQESKEVIIIVRSNLNPSGTEAITISDPTPQLLQYLKTMQGDVVDRRQLDVARMREHR